MDLPIKPLPSFAVFAVWKMMSTMKQQDSKKCSIAIAVLLSLLIGRPVSAFSPRINIATTRQSSSRNPIVLSGRLYAQTTQSSPNNETLPAPSDMRLREIQSELQERNISYSDCFDRESLVKRLVDARDGLVQPSSPPEKEDATPPPAEPTPVDNTANAKAEPVTAPASDETFDRQSTLTELRTLRVKELKVKLSEMHVRWGTMIEKEDMVQALCQAMEQRFEQSKNFSRSGKLIPGTVSDVDESTLIEELGWLESDVKRGVASTASDGASSSTHSPILLDCYATWCGPCQFMVPFFKEAAVELGPTVRVMKLDSDKYPQICSVLKVGGLPTLIRFDGGDVSKEVQRVEGALTKDQILDFVNGDFKM